MKKYINRNYFWADLFVAQISHFGVNHVCISPGSRNTPLTLSFASNNSFKKYIHIDERSSGFFALGIAKALKKPVALVVTSGTAVAELYPAIIEAFNQRVTLIICTADRPSFLRNTGANQTINQDNIYSNHIRAYADLGLPSINKKNLKSYCSKIVKNINCSINDPGPIHFNFPFKKPLEPNSFTENINYKILDFAKPKEKVKEVKLVDNKIDKLCKMLKLSQKPIIHLGWGELDERFISKLSSFSSNAKIPLFADGANELRFYKRNVNNIITNQSAFLPFLKEEPDLIIQFGNAPTSQALLKYFEESGAKRFLINKYGDIKDPSRKKGTLVKLENEEAIYKIDAFYEKSDKTNEWFKFILDTESRCEFMKNQFIEKLEFGMEPRIVPEMLNVIPKHSNLFVSNSMPIRDFDLFGARNKHNLKIYTNRGASGIDGIISTASGIASQSDKPTFLLIGDLAFYHNMSALSTLNELKINLKIILVNNNGGGIFKMLPVAQNKVYFEKYFNTAHDVNFRNIVKSFAGNYYLPKSWRGFRSTLKRTMIENSYSVIELKTDSQKSVEARREYIAQISSIFN